MKKFFLIVFIAFFLLISSLSQNINKSVEDQIKEKNELILFTYEPFNLDNDFLVTNILDFYPQSFIYEIGNINNIKYIDLTYLNNRVILQLINNKIYKTIYESIDGKNIIYTNDLNNKISKYEIVPADNLDNKVYINPFLYFEENIYEKENFLTSEKGKIKVYESIFDFKIKLEEFKNYEQITLTDLACIYKISLGLSLKWAENKYLPYERINVKIITKQCIDFKYERYIKNSDKNKIIYSTSKDGSMQLKLLETASTYIFKDNIYDLNMYDKPREMDLCDDYYLDLGEKIINENM